MNCEFCYKIFGSKGNLLYHQRHSKSCLLIQNKEIVEIECLYCNKSFSNKNIKRHIEKCKIKNETNLLLKKNIEIKTLKIENERLNDEMSTLKIQIENLKNENLVLKTKNEIFIDDHKEILKLARKPTTNNNIHISNSYFNDDVEKIREIIENNLELNDITYGQKGIAGFVMMNLLTDDDSKLTYYCTDSSRNIFKYKTSSGSIEKDIKAKKLSNILNDAGIASKSFDILNNSLKKGEISDNNYKIFQPSVLEIKKISSDNSIFAKELSELVII